MNDSSKDKTPEILAKYSDKIIAIKTPKNTGNKSSAQEYGLKFVTGDVMITTDGDTLLDTKFVEEMEKSFQDPNVAAVAGYVKSLPGNWLTLCRAFYYVIGQDIHKVAQSYLNYIFVMPGAASAFRTEAFRKYITFDHDTITEDLDFTYKMHRNNFKIVYNTKAICYTQDPSDMKSYVNQMRRWYSGGWQNLMKHINIINHPIRALELSLIYIEGLVFSSLIFIVPILNPYLEIYLLLGTFLITMIYAIWATIRTKKISLLLVPFPYVLLIFINAALFLESFFKEVILKKKNLVWFKPERVNINVS